MKQRAFAVAALLAALAITLIALPYVALMLAPPTESQLGSLQAEASTAHGEWVTINIKLKSLTKWGASYYVNGSGSYTYLKITVSLTVGYENCQDVLIDYADVKAYGVATKQEKVYPILAQISVEFPGARYTDDTGDISISTHLSDLGYDPSGSDMLVRYYVRFRVVATGSISGDTLEAVLNWTYFVTYEYDYIPPGGVCSTCASWLKAAKYASLIGLVVLMPIAALWATKVLKPRRRRD